MDQLLEWKGDFGREYTDRNVVDWRTRVEGFRAFMPPDAHTVLEVGCNRGHNLLALRSLGYDVTGVEPQQYARAIARYESLVPAYDGDIYTIPAGDETTDLVFTSGVLIHVPPHRLDDAIAEMVRVSRRYVLCIEYHADTDTEKVYRGRGGMMWNRDYGRHLERHGLTLVGSGMLGPEFDTARFVLAEKSSSDRSG